MTRYPLEAGTVGIFLCLGVFSLVDQNLIPNMQSIALFVSTAVVGAFVQLGRSVDETGTQISEMGRSIRPIISSLPFGADSFFHKYETIKDQFFQLAQNASKITINAHMPFGVLQTYEQHLRKILEREGGVVEVILTLPGSPADRMSEDRATKDENLKRPRNIEGTTKLLQELENHARNVASNNQGKSGCLRIKTTEYWPSCIYSLAVTHYGDDASEVMLVTINSSGVNDPERNSFLIEKAKDPRAYKIFRDDLDHVASGASPLADAKALSDLFEQARNNKGIPDYQ